MDERKIFSSSQVIIFKMSYLNQMYGINSSSKNKEETKNPNRVAGGLKGQSADHLVMMNEDGTETRVPTQRYVQALHEQIKEQKAAINLLERKLSRVSKESEATRTMLQTIQKNRG